MVVVTCNYMNFLLTIYHVVVCGLHGQVAFVDWNQGWVKVYVYVHGVVPGGVVYICVYCGLSFNVGISLLLCLSFCRRIFKRTLHVRVRGVQ